MSISKLLIAASLAATTLAIWEIEEPSTCCDDGSCLDDHVCHDSQPANHCNTGGEFCSKTPQCCKGLICTL